MNSWTFSDKSFIYITDTGRDREMVHQGRHARSQEVRSSHEKGLRDTENFCKFNPDSFRTN